MGKLKDINRINKLKQPIRISADRRDIFIEKNKEGRFDDLHQQIRDASK